MSSLKEGDAAAGAVAKGPRVTLADIEAAIDTVYYRTGIECIESRGGALHGPLECLTVAFVVMKNGFVVLGQSACASPENFNLELGRKFALEDAHRAMWKLMGFALRDSLWHDSQIKAPGQG